MPAKRVTLVRSPVGITAAMPDGTGLASLCRDCPDRFFDFGIAEQGAVAIAAGLAAGGYHPVVAIYATFMNRAFDQVLMDVALHKAGVTFVLDRAGVTGPDGPSHHGVWDLAMLQLVPGIRIAAPRDAAPPGPRGRARVVRRLRTSSGSSSARRRRPTGARDGG